MADSGKEIGTRCHHCAGPLTKNLETNKWTVAPFIRDSFSMIGSAVGGTASAFIGFNHVMPIVRKWIKGPMSLHFLVGAPPVIVVSSACAGLAGLVIISILLFVTNLENFQLVKVEDVLDLLTNGILLLLLLALSVVISVNLYAELVTGGAVPALAQLASSSYHAAVHSSQPPQGQEKNKLHKSSTISPL